MHFISVTSFFHRRIMKRRQALQSLAILGAGLTILPSCRTKKYPEYRALGLREDQIELVDQVATAVLPVGQLPVETPESRLDFIMTMLRDCTSPEDQSRYKNGLEAFQSYLKDQFHPSFSTLNQRDQMKALAYLQEGEKDQQLFYEHTRRWAIQHFTTSSYYLTNVLDFHFVPGHFYGCVAI